MRRCAAVSPTAHHLALVLSLVGLGCLQPTTELEGDSMPLAEWCTDSLENITCRPQIACGVADPDAGCAAIVANARLRSAPDPCSPSLLAAVDAGSVRYDGRAAARCRQDALTRCEDPAPGRTDCAAVFVGTGAETTPCSFDAQCAAGLWCSFEGSVCPGVCRPRLVRGEVTTEPVACATETIESLDGGAYRCIDLPLEGQPCAHGPFCAGGLFCDTQTRLCTASLAVGAPCLSAQRCVPGASCVNGRCARFAPRGAACAPLFFATDLTLPPCQLGLACRAGLCGDLLQAGESCRAVDSHASRCPTPP